jgi:hypothetical protein
MFRKYFTSAGFPAYHSGMLIVKMRPSAANLAPLAGGRHVMTSMTETPGVSALTMFDRAGLVKRVTPIVSQTETESPMPPRGVVAALAMSARSEDADHTNAGLNLMVYSRWVSTLQSSSGKALR